MHAYEAPNFLNITRIMAIHLQVYKKKLYKPSHLIHNLTDNDMYIKKIFVKKQP